MFYAFKPLRILLLLSAILLILFPNEPGTEILIECPSQEKTQANKGTVENTNRESSMFCKEVFTSLFLTVLAPLVFFVLLLDVLMSAVQIGEHQGKRRQSFIIVVFVNIAMVIGFLVAWLPFFTS
jgi:hypothetical protein